MIMVRVSTCYSMMQLVTLSISQMEYVEIHVVPMHTKKGLRLTSANQSNLIQSSFWQKETNLHTIEIIVIIVTAHSLTVRIPYFAKSNYQVIVITTIVVVILLQTVPIHA